jgi:hypothetical protein
VRVLDGLAITAYVGILVALAFGAPMWIMFWTVPAAIIWYRLGSREGEFPEDDE